MKSEFILNKNTNTKNFKPKNLTQDPHQHKIKPGQIQRINPPHHQNIKTEYRFHFQTTRPHTFSCSFFHYNSEEDWTFLPWAKSFLRNQTQKHYLNLCSLSIFSHLKLSLLSWMKFIVEDAIPLSLLSSQTRALSLYSHDRSFSWIKTHGLSSSLNPWLKTHGRNPMVEDPKTHGRNPRLTKISSSLSLSLSLSKVLSLVWIVSRKSKEEACMLMESNANDGHRGLI